MQYVCIRQTKRLKSGINIQRQLFTMHTPSGEHQTPEGLIGDLHPKIRFLP